MVLCVLTTVTLEDYYYVIDLITVLKLNVID